MIILLAKILVSFVSLALIIAIILGYIVFMITL